MPRMPEIAARIRMLRMLRERPPLTALLEWSVPDSEAYLWLLRNGYTEVEKGRAPDVDRCGLTELGRRYLADLERNLAPTNGGPSS